MDEKVKVSLEKAVQLVREVMKDEEVPLVYGFILAGVLIGINMSMGVSAYQQSIDVGMTDEQLKNVLFFELREFVDERL